MDWVMIILWSVFIVITVIIELETSQLVTIWFTIGAIGGLIAAAFQLNEIYQIAIFLVISLILLFATRPLTKRMMESNVIRTNADKVIGMIGVITKEVLPGEIGEVKVDNTLWRAANFDNKSFAVGEKVSIDAISGTKLIISKIDNSNITPL
ncbi:MAG: NfeD family protein [Bacilli bacterium]|jgi:membrane protein implicated in regulation of membrane protease activity|nr:NfeD family protein [Bacilli bacterium]